VVPKGHFQALGMMAALVAAPGLGDAVIITHEPAACMVVGKFPRLEARVEPLETVKSVRAYFHADGASFWSYTDMRSEAGVFRATLMKPPKGAREVYYYFVATEASGVRSTSQEYLVEVVRDRNQCSDPKRIATSVDSASPVIGRGDVVPRARTAVSNGSNGKTIGLTALGALGVAGGIVAVTHGGGTHGGGTAPPLRGTFAGSLDGYTQVTLGPCLFLLDVSPGGAINVTLTDSQAAANFSFPRGTFYAQIAGVGCDVPAPLPPLNAEFLHVMASGNSVSGQGIVGYQTFVLDATVNGSSLGGVVHIMGGPPGNVWASGIATIHGMKTQ
jgi:hypothetical protein